MEKDNEFKVATLITVLVLFILSACTARQTFCTAEAKLCPDGSAVGRSGPNCEFAKCQSNSADSITELKYTLLEKFNNNILVCGPPVPQIGYETQELKKFDEIAKSAEFNSILNHKGLTNSEKWSDNDKLIVVREHEKLSAIALEEVGDKYKFNLISQGFQYEGFIASDGKIEVTKKKDYPYGCPICLSGETLISTSTGQIKIKNLQNGMEVLTADNSGNQQRAIILEAARTRVPENHKMVHLLLKDGRELFASLGHPAADGRKIGNLRKGDNLDGSEILISELIDYKENFTYDILPSGNTGTYWANGILIGSTLKR